MAVYEFTVVPILLEFELFSACLWELGHSKQLSTSEKIQGMVTAYGKHGWSLYEVRDMSNANLVDLDIGGGCISYLVTFYREAKGQSVRKCNGNAGFSLIGKNPYGYDEYAHQGTGMVFVHIPGVDMVKKSILWGLGIDHSVPLKVSGFLMSREPVTYQAFYNIRPSKAENTVPVSGVGLSGYREFCERHGFRFPTMVEMEYACKGGIDAVFYWGDRLDQHYLWCRKNTRRVQPVGQKRPNRYGLFDMSGNVWGVCEDRCCVGLADDITSLDSELAKYHIVRGGSYKSRIGNCMSEAWSHCGDVDPDEVGLRCVVDFEEEQATLGKGE